MKGRGQVTAVTGRTQPLKGSQGGGGELQTQGQEVQRHPNLSAPCSAEEEVEALQGLPHTPFPLQGPCWSLLAQPRLWRLLAPLSCDHHSLRDVVRPGYCGAQSPPPSVPRPQEAPSVSPR